MLTTKKKMIYKILIRNKMTKIQFEQTKQYETLLNSSII